MPLMILDLKRAVLGVLALSATLAAAARAQTPAQPPPASAEVAIHFVAVDKQNDPAGPLGPEDIRVTEEGRPRAVTGVRRLSGPPLSLVVAVDTSVSQERVVGATKLAAAAFVSGVMRPGVDEFGVVTFTGEPTVAQRPTGDAAQVRAAVAGIKVVLPPGYIRGGIVVGRPPPRAMLTGSTAVWDAVSFVSEQVLSHGPKEARRALILITDGVDTSSRLKRDDAARAALRAGVVVYAVGIGDERDFDGVDEGGLRRLAERTGGRAFFPKKPDELAAVFARIQADLLSPYVVTFAATGAGRDGALRKVRLEVVNPELRRRGVRLFHPEGYFAR